MGSSGKLYSQVLREERSYYVWLPPNARNPLYAKPHYPVLYVLDGETQFLSVAATVERLSALRVLPEAIIVAVRNTDRTRDLTPSHIESGLYMDREAAATSGGGENFTRFLRQELLPHIDSMYAPAPYRMLIGTSLGGLFVLHTLVHHPDLFKGYVAIDPSLWWDDARLVREVGAVLGRARLGGKTLYLPVALAFKAAGDTAAAAARATPARRALLAVPDFVAHLRRYPGAGLRWAAQYYRHETHNSLPIPGTYDALRHAFGAHQFLAVDHVSLFDPGTSTLRAAAIRDSLLLGCQAISRQMGYPVRPPEILVNRLGYAYLRRKDYPAAFTFFALNQANYPASFNVHDALGDYYRAVGNKRQAIREFKQALARFEYPETQQKLRALQAK